MGDVGSIFLGYLLGGLLLFAVTLHPNYALLIVASTLLFTGDATYTLLLRIVKKEMLWQGHRSHWYQRIYNMGYTHNIVFMYGVAMNSSFLVVYLLALKYDLTLAGFAISVQLTLLSWLIIQLSERKAKRIEIEETFEGL